MLNGVTIAALLGNYYYFHPEYVKTVLGLKEKAKKPVLVEEDDFEPPRDWEVERKEYLNKVIRENEKKTKIKLTDNKIYRGEAKKIDGEKVPYGKGYVEFENGKRMVGSFINGELNGEGGIVDPDVSQALGNYKNGELEGLGAVLFPFKSYRGYFVNGAPSGKGKWNFDGGSSCVTETIDQDNITAKCYTKDNELYYQGDYKNFSYTGKGKFYFDNGETYEGDLKDGKLDGYGTQRDKYGDKMYSGEFVDNVFKGKMDWKEVYGYLAIGVLNMALSLLKK